MRGLITAKIKKKIFLQLLNIDHNIIRFRLYNFLSNMIIFSPYIR